MRDSDHITKEEARIHASNYINSILQFVEPVNDARPALGFLQPVILLKEMRERIEKSNPPFRTNIEVKSYLRPVQNGVIQFLPPIRKQLNDFWSAQNAIIQESNKAKKSYNPADILDRNYQIITDINLRFETVLGRFTENPNDEVNIDALFYLHILRTETLAKRLLEQLTTLLRKYNITNFDPVSIYSIDPPIKKVSGGKTSYLTDAEALRHSLAHNKYEITFDNQSWNVEFDNNNEFGYHYKKNFTQKTFVEYLKQLEILYKGTQILTYILTVWGIVTAVLVEK